jgi:hypothetical protein
MNQQGSKLNHKQKNRIQPEYSHIFNGKEVGRAELEPKRVQAANSLTMLSLKRANPFS